MTLDFSNKREKISLIKLPVASTGLLVGISELNQETSEKKAVRDHQFFLN